jgi:hypothetical protein
MPPSREEKAAEKLLRHTRTSMVRTSETRPVCLVDLVCFVYLVSLVQPNKQDKPNKPIKRDRPDRPNRPDEQDGLADCFSILLEEGVTETGCQAWRRAGGRRPRPRPR